MNRREFVQALLGTAAALTVVPSLDAFIPAESAPIWAITAEKIGLTCGDMFSIAGVTDINPRTGVDTGLLKRFIVTKDVTSDQSAEAAIFPPLITDGCYRNVSALPAPDAKLYVYSYHDYRPILAEEASWLQG